MLCNICNQFQGGLPIEKKPETQEGRRDGDRNFLVPQLPWPDLTESAKSCYVCQIILRGCHKVFKQNKIDEANVRLVDIRFFYPTNIEDADTGDSDKHLILHLSDGTRFEIEIVATPEDDSEVPNDWDYIATSRRTSLRTDSGEAMAKINGWIAECTTEHEEILCTSPSTSKLPKRVIDVGSNNTSIRLVEPNGARDRYLCLSHCWGLEQIITTTTSTFHQRKQNIHWHDLSQTFRDSITLTRTLGFRYIWIDSLCIIQDSASDWATESAQMASIYSAAFLTIAGTKSPNGAGGLFTSTPDVRVSGTTPRDERYSIFFRERIDHQIDNILESAGMTSSEKYYPLLSRAWVYQERMLSTRILHFGHFEVFFECKSTIQCECEGIRFWGAGTESPMSLIKIEYADALADFGEGYTGSALEEVKYQGARMWRTMVSAYTALRLTKSKDRLPAFGGLARQMGAARQARYFAGLWEDSMNDDLLWEVYTTPELKQGRPEPRNAPTWSWASVESRAGVGYWDSIIFTSLDEEGMEARQPCEHFSKVEACDIAVDSADEFGLLRNGALKISGLVVEGVLGTLRREDGEIEHSVTFQDASFRMQSDYLLSDEGPNQVASGATVTCLCMSVVRAGEKDCLISLVLKHAPSKPECFERIGTLKIKGAVASLSPETTIYRDAQRRTMVII